MKKLLDGLLGSLPIWAGMMVIILSFILWHAQRREEIDDLETIISIQTKHMSELVFHEIHDKQLDIDGLKKSLIRDHYQGFSLLIEQNNKTIFRHGYVDDDLRKSWGNTVVLITAMGRLSLSVWPDHEYVHARYSHLPLVAFLMGVVMGILLMIVGMLAQLASRRSKVIMMTNKKVREQMEEKQKLRRIVQHTQKLQAIGTLAGGIAHDFNNILYAMMGYVNLARDDVAKDSVIYRNLGKVLAAGERGQKLISSILSFSRQQQPHALKPVDLVVVLSHVFELVAMGMPTTVTVEKQLQVKEAWVMGDQSSLEQVLMNIINNAVDAVEFHQRKHGLITVGLRVHALAKRFEIRVQDNGCGMDEATKQRIFEPFFTTKPVDSGTGLGLSLAHGIIEEHDGSIEVESIEGEGTTFVVLLPMMQKREGDSDGKNSIS